MRSLLLVSSTFALIPPRAIAKGVCDSDIFEDLLPLSDYAPATNYCNARFPVPTLTTTVTASPTGWEGWNKRSPNWNDWGSEDDPITVNPCKADSARFSTLQALPSSSASAFCSCIQTSVKETVTTTPAGTPKSSKPGATTSTSFIGASVSQTQWEAWSSTTSSALAVSTILSTWTYAWAPYDPSHKWSEWGYSTSSNPAGLTTSKTSSKPVESTTSRSSSNPAESTTSTSGQSAEHTWGDWGNYTSATSSTSETKASSSTTSTSVHTSSTISSTPASSKASSGTTSASPKTTSTTSSTLQSSKTRSTASTTSQSTKTSTTTSSTSASTKSSSVSSTISTDKTTVSTTKITTASTSLSTTRTSSSSSPSSSSSSSSTASTTKSTTNSSNTSTTKSTTSSSTESTIASTTPSTTKSTTSSLTTKSTTTAPSTPSTTASTTKSTTVSNTKSTTASTTQITTSSSTTKSTTSAATTTTASSTTSSAWPAGPTCTKVASCDEGIINSEGCGSGPDTYCHRTTSGDVYAFPEADCNQTCYTDNDCDAGAVCISNDNICCAMNQCASPMSMCPNARSKRALFGGRYGVEKRSVTTQNFKGDDYQS